MTKAPIFTTVLAISAALALSACQKKAAENTTAPAAETTAPAETTNTAPEATNTAPAAANTTATNTTGNTQ